MYKEEKWIAKVKKCKKRKMEMHLEKLLKFFALLF